ncbi:ferredoxin [Nocardioides sp. R1-1]|uniref:ferredoxin n=1 Tax=Nocardioides sp. R1-1 TaxID=3383502 RepID=UPI0038D0B2C1
MAVRADNRLADAPMHPVACESCSAQVLVRKASWHQTSVQWTDEAMATCRAWSPGCAAQGLAPTCDRLGDSIARAVVDGDLPVLGAGYDEEKPTA